MKRIKQSATNLHTEEGATLVELLAAIAILSIVVVSFLAYFIQAGNTNNRTDRVNEATFLAQEEMEYVMYYRQGKSLDTYKNSDDYKGRRDINGFTVDTVIDKSGVNDSEIKMYQVVVNVNEKGGTAHAQMETWLPIEEDEEIQDEAEK